MGIRICLVSSYPPVQAGESTYAQSYVHALETYLSKEITEIHILSHVDSTKEQQQNISNDGDKVKVYRLFNSGRFFSKNLSFLKIFRKIRQIRPDLVHFHYAPIPKSRFGGFLGEPLLILFLILRIIDVPFFVTLHSVWYPDQIESRAYELTKNRVLSKLARHYFKTLMYFFGRIPDRLFIMVTAKETKIIQTFSQAYHIPIRHLRAELHGLWYDDESVSANHDLGSKKIVCLGFIVPNKGYEHVLTAMRTVLKKIPDASLLIAGSSISQEAKEYFKKLRHLAHELSLDRSVTIEERYLSEAEFMQHIRTAGIVIAPYVRAIGPSGIVSSAISHKVPAIVTASGPIFEEISDTVPVIPLFNNGAIADEIIKILDSKEYRKNLVKNYEKYLSDHDWSVVTRDNYVDYVRILKLKKRFKEL